MLDFVLSWFKRAPKACPTCIDVQRFREADRMLSEYLDSEQLEASRLKFAMQLLEDGE